MPFNQDTDGLIRNTIAFAVSYRKKECSPPSPDAERLGHQLPLRAPNEMACIVCYQCSKSNDLGAERSTACPCWASMRGFGALGRDKKYLRKPHMLAARFG